MKPSISRNYCQKCVREKLLTFLLQKFRESNVFTKEFIWRNIFCWDYLIFHFSTHLQKKKDKKLQLYSPIWYTFWIFIIKYQIKILVDQKLVYLYAYSILYAKIVKSTYLVYAKLRMITWACSFSNGKKMTWIERCCPGLVSQLQKLSGNRSSRGWPTGDLCSGDRRQSVILSADFRWAGGKTFKFK